MTSIPMKGTLTRQVNVKIDEQTFQDIEHLRHMGVDMGELLRPVIIGKLKQARKVLDQREAG